MQLTQQEKYVWVGGVVWVRWGGGGGGVRWCGVGWVGLGGGQVKLG